MTRIRINLDPDDEAWLECEARIRNLSVAEMVRQAVRAFRVQLEKARLIDLQAALRRTQGIWKRADGLVHQRRLREEWDGRD